MSRTKALSTAIASLLMLAIPAAHGAEDEKPAATKPAEPLVVIHAGTLIAVPGRAPLQHATIVVRGKQIESVKEGYSDVPGARVIDLKKDTVLPGLIDCHVHLTTPLLPGSRSGVRASSADYALAGVVHARQTLDAGFTTVRDLGADSEAIFPLRNAIQRGEIAGPRVIAAGRLIGPTGGHGDVGGGYPDAIRVLLVGGSTCDGAADCRRAVRRQVMQGADVIKIATTGGGGDAGGNEDAAPEMQFDEVEAIVQTAHALGRKVAAHAHGTAGILLALRAGVDSIEHGGFIDSEGIAQLKKRDATLVPTMSVIDKIAKEIDKADAKDKPRMQGFLDKMPKNVGAAYRSGARIAFGTDASITEHGANAHEFEWYLRIGMTPTAALQSATVNAAQLLGLEKEIGTIEPGKSADIVASEADPLTDVAALKKIVFVMKSGTVHRNPP